MLAVRRKQAQVFRAIVQTIAIYVMDNLSWLKIAPKMRLHHKMMLSDIAVSISAGVLRAKE